MGLREQQSGRVAEWEQSVRVGQFARAREAHMRARCATHA